MPETKLSSVLLHNADKHSFDVMEHVSKQQLSHVCDNLHTGKVVIVGDIMIDRYLEGDAERISPEAPVPVVLVQKESALLGGAGNVARNIRALGGKASLVGICGDDKDGDLLAGMLDDSSIDHTLVRVKNHPTTVKTRVMARHQQMLRIDFEHTGIVEGTTFQSVLQATTEKATEAGAIIISDYDKGLITKDFMVQLQKKLASGERPLPVFVDPKPSNIAYYKGVTLLTPNAKEAAESSRLPVKSKEEIIAAGIKILEDLGCPHLVITLGAMGMAVFCGKDEVWHIPTAAQKVFDVTGAGDTVIGVSALAVASGASLLEACILANYAAGIVVGQVGAATATLEELKHTVNSLSHDVVTRWL